MRAKFPVTRGMTKKTTHRGRQQQTLLLFDMRSLVSKEPLLHGCLQWLRPVLQEINPCSCPCPHSSCWWCPRKVFLNSGLTQAGVSLVAQTWEANLWTSVSQPSGKVTPFSHSGVQNTNLLLFLQLPVSQRHSSLLSLAAVEQLISPAQVLPPTWDRKRAGSEAAGYWTPVWCFCPCPSTAVCPALCPAPHKCLWGPAWASTCSVQNTYTTALEREGHTGLWGEEKEGEAHSCYWSSMLWLQIHRAFPHKGKEMCILKGLTLSFLDPTTFKKAC